MRNLIRQGCFTSAGLGTIIGIASLLLTVLTGREALAQIIKELQQGTASLFPSIAAALTSPLSIPIWVFFIIIVLASFGAFSVVWNYVRRYVRPIPTLSNDEKPEVFRDLLFGTKIGLDEEIIVSNELEPICAICNSPIVGTDNYDNVNFYYLRCAEGHFIGQDIKYAEYKKAADADRKRWDEAEAKRDAEIALIDKKIKDGTATEDELKEWDTMPAPQIRDYLDPKTEVKMPELQRGYLMPTFYAEIVNDFKIKKAKEQITVWRARHEKSRSK